MPLYAVLGFLFPIGVYCLVLAAINRRPRPLLVSGFWDTLGLLCAACGFFLITTPMLLNEFYQQTLKSLLSEQFEAIWVRHWLIWLLYYLLLISGCTFLVLWRKHKTMIYNVDLEAFQQILESVFAPIGLDAAIQHHRLTITPATAAPNQETAVMEGIPASAPVLPTEYRFAELEVENFPALCHVTLHWHQYVPEVRREIEEELQKRLENAAPQDNPAAGWFLTVSGLIFGMLVMVLLTVLFLLFTAR